MKYTFISEIIKKENSLDIDNICDRNNTKKKFDKDKIKIYSLISAVVLAAILFMVIQVFSVIDLHLDNQYSINSYEIICLGSMLVFFIFVMILLKFLRWKHISLFVGAILYLLLSMILWRLYCVNNGLEIKYKFLYMFILLTLIGMPFILAEGFIANVVGIQNTNLSAIHIISVCIIAAGCYMITYILVSPFSKAETVNIYSLIGLSLGVICAYLLFPVLIAFNLSDDKKSGKNYTISAVGGVAQDGLLWSIFSIVINIAIYYPFFYSSNCMQILEILLSAVPAMIWPLSFCMKNNANHIKQKNKKNLTKEQIDSLQFHLRCQNTVFFLALVPISTAGLLIEIFFLTSVVSKQTNLKSIWHKLKNSYWPTAKI